MIIYNYNNHIEFNINYKLFFLSRLTLNNLNLTDVSNLTTALVIDLNLLQNIRNLLLINLAFQ